MYKYIGRGPVVRISRFQVTIPCYYCHYQSPESREHNIDIYSSAVNARVRTPATEIASSFSHFAIWHFALCVCVSVCAQRKEEIKSPIGTWHDCNGKMLVLMKCTWVSLSLYFLFLSTRETGRLLCHSSF